MFPRTWQHIKAQLKGPTYALVLPAHTASWPPMNTLAHLPPLWIFAIAPTSRMARLCWFAAPNLVMEGRSPGDYLHIHSALDCVVMPNLQANNFRRLMHCKIHISFGEQQPFHVSCTHTDFIHLHFTHSKYTMCKYCTHITPHIWYLYFAWGWRLIHQDFKNAPNSHQKLVAEFKGGRAEDDLGVRKSGKIIQKLSFFYFLSLQE